MPDETKQSQFVFAKAERKLIHPKMKKYLLSINALNPKSLSVFRQVNRLRYLQDLHKRLVAIVAQFENESEEEKTNLEMPTMGYERLPENVTNVIANIILKILQKRCVHKMKIMLHFLCFKIFNHFMCSCYQWITTQC